MRTIIQDINEISDSRELMESKPHRFVEIFIYILITLLIGALIWAYFGEIDDYVKANGVVRPDEKISTIKNKITGKVEQANLEEGKKVKKGDILFIIEHKSLQLDKDELEEQLKKTSKEHANLKKLKQSILEEKNYFEQKDEEEKQYYSKYVQYETSMEVLSKQVELDSQNLKNVKDDLNNLELLKQSIETGKNLFKETNGVYYNRYQQYSLNVKKLNDDMDQKKVAYEGAKELSDLEAISKKELDDTKRLLISTEIDLQKYQSEYISNLNTEIENSNKSLKEFELNLKTTDSSFDNKQEVNEVSLQKYKVDTLVGIDDDVVNDEKSIESLQKQLDSINLNIEDSVVKASIDGVINIISEINKGDLLQSGIDVATIVPEADSQFKVQIYISNKDVAKVKEGDKIKYHFLALPYKEYGELTGKITKIGTDSKVDKEGGNFYIAEAEIENRPLFSYKGDKGEIKVGMACEAQVVNRTKKILYYVLEKINLRD